MTYKPATGLSQKQIEKEVSRQAVLFEEELKKGHNISSMKFSDFFEKWLVDYAQIKLKKSTLSKYEISKKRVFEHFGHLRIDKITPVDVQSFVSKLVASGFATNYVKGYVRLVSVVLNYAVKKRLLTYNLCTTVDYPRNVVGERCMYKLEEAKEFLSVLQDLPDSQLSFKAYFTLLMYTGARKGELLALQWSDVDFKNKSIFINKGYYYSHFDNESYVDTPKNTSSIRTIKLSDTPMQVLTELAAWQEENLKTSLDTNNGYLFVSMRSAKVGKPMSVGAPNEWLRKFCERNNMKHVTVHSFRHFTASALINSGIDVVSVQHLLGHSTPAVTLSTYSHAFGDKENKTKDAVASILG